MMEYQTSEAASVVCTWEHPVTTRQVRCHVVPSANPSVYQSSAIELGIQQKSEIADLFAAELPGIRLLSGQILKLHRQLQLAERSPNFGQTERYTLDSHVAFIQEELHSVRDRLKLRILNLLNDDQKRRIDDVEVAFALRQLA
jgi:hypothetical protein